jgi:ATP-dependent helicase/nuclease subunit A
VFSKKDKSVKEKESNVEVAVISIPNAKPADTSDDENDFIAMEWESEYIASQIEKLIGKEKNNDGSLIKPSDIAILFRSKRISPYISAALRRRGIKSAETDSTQYFENDDVLMMLCILNTIDNPERDIYLAGTLRSPLFHFTADDILTIRRNHGEPLSLFGGLLQYMRENNDSLSKKCKDFYDTLTVWQDISVI